MNGEFALIITAALCNLLVGSVVFSRAKSRLSNKLFLLVAVSVGSWCAGIALFLASANGPQARLLVNLYYFSAWCIGLSIWAFSRVWLGKKLPRLALLFSLFVILPLVVLVLDPRLIVTAVRFHPHLGVTFNPLTQIFYSVGFIGSFCLGVYELWRGMGKSVGLQRSQLKLMVVGFLSAGLLGIICNLILPWFGVYELIWLGPICSVLFVGSVAYAIVKHRLFDIHSFIVRSMAYVMSLIFLAATYGLVVFGVLKLAFHLDVGLWTQVFIAAATAFAAILFGTIKSFFDRVSNRLFYHDAYDSQELLDRLNRLFVINTDLEQLLRQTSTILEENLHAEYCLFGIKESGENPSRIIGRGAHRDFRPEDVSAIRRATPTIHHKIIVTDELEGAHESLRRLFESNDIAVLGRLTASTRHNTEGLGYLVLGPRRSGNPYTSSDIRILEIIVNELVIAIENSLRFEEISHFNETLQDRVNIATHKLRQTNDKLQALDATKDEFITMASHQLRTPLTSVKGYLSMVLEGDAGKLNAQQEQLLTQSYASSQRMVYLISDLLNLSRLNTGKFVIEPSPVDLRNVVLAEIDQLRETAKSRGVTIAYANPASFPKLMLDETKIHQVIMNFIDNAIYYTPAGGSITVSLRETPTAVEYLVEDTGIGVPKAEQHRLFTKFYRAPNAQRARPDGTGLGLFMAKKVIVAQGGAIIFDSVEGKGSTFGFRFSKAKHMAPSAQPTPKAAVAK